MAQCPGAAAFTVVDPKRARAWYAAALGFELLFDFQPPGGGPATMLHTPDGALIELFEVPEVSDGQASGTAMLPRVRQWSTSRPHAIMGYQGGGDDRCADPGRTR
jgi:catechol 2,3-dioxygenase-like lactoylglutathione lyase family enzyme